MKNQSQLFRKGIAALCAMVISVASADGAFAQGTKKPKYQEIEVQDGGTISGKVTFEGPIPELKLQVAADKQVCLHDNGTVPSPRLSVGPEGGLADTIVYLRDIAAGKPLSDLKAAMTLDQVGCLYKPFVQVARYKEYLTLINSDPVNHNVHARLEGARDPFNNAMPNSNWPKKQTIQKRMTRSGILAVSCDVHLWMNAYVWVVRHPYYAVTGTDGTFELTDVPPGTYEVLAWHPGWHATVRRNGQGQFAGYRYADAIEKSATVEVEPGRAATADFKFSD